MTAKAEAEQLTDEEAARLRDEVVKRMIATPPTPHKPKREPGRPNSRPVSVPNKG